MADDRTHDMPIVAMSIPPTTHSAESINSDVKKISGCKVKAKDVIFEATKSNATN